MSRTMGYMRRRGAGVHEVERSVELSKTRVVMSETGVLIRVLMNE